MTLARASAVLLLAAGASCVFPDTTVGDACTASTACSAERLCLPLDADNFDGDAVCLPMREIEGAPIACTTPLDCVSAGFPVDAVCEPQDGTGDLVCSCPGDGGGGFACKTFDEDGNDVVRTFNALTCQCETTG